MRGQLDPLVFRGWVIFCVLKVRGCHTNKDRQWHPIDIDERTTKTEDAYDHELRVTQSMHKNLTSEAISAKAFILWTQSTFCRFDIYAKDTKCEPILHYNKVCLWTSPLRFDKWVYFKTKREKSNKLMNKSGNSTIVKPHKPHHIFLLICVRQDVLLSYPVYIGHYTDSLTMKPTTLLL